MLEKSLLYRALWTTFCFAIWPLIARKSGLPQAWIMLFMGIGLILGSIVFFNFVPKQSFENRTGDYTSVVAIFILILGVSLNVTGLMSFTGIITSDSIYKFAFIAMIMYAVPPLNKIIVPFFDREEHVSWINMIGIIIMAVGIPFVMYKKSA